MVWLPQLSLGIRQVGLQRLTLREVLRLQWGHKEAFLDGSKSPRGYCLRNGVAAGFLLAPLGNCGFGARPVCPAVPAQPVNDV